MLNSTISCQGTDVLQKQFNKLQMRPREEKDAPEQNHNLGRRVRVSLPKHRSRKEMLNQNGTPHLGKQIHQAAIDLSTGNRRCICIQMICSQARVTESTPRTRCEETALEQHDCQIQPGPSFIDVASARIHEALGIQTRKMVVCIIDKCCFDSGFSGTRNVLEISEVRRQPHKPIYVQRVS